MHQRDRYWYSGRRINEVSDTSGKLTLSVWKATDVLSGIHDFQVDVLILGMHRRWWNWKRTRT